MNPEGEKSGTWYECGCWYQGNPDEHPHECIAHKRRWKFRLKPVIIQKSPETLK